MNYLTLDFLVTPLCLAFELDSEDKRIEWKRKLERSSTCQPIDSNKSSGASRIIWNPWKIKIFRDKKRFKTLTWFFGFFHFLFLFHRHVMYSLIFLCSHLLLIGQPKYKERRRCSMLIFTFLSNLEKYSVVVSEYLSQPNSMAMF